ncbi:MAG: ATP-dependent DNA ligase [Ferroplasma sp.]|uniref:ATP-dependent DNA ligase n=1 Tax=Ferroplasma sp. TaxID=2591003 RepID=UPI002814D30A|nr:ATP-dependent DNA ligase [Ferroplasma sp.]WMT51881.1 MAG: ATP-dependent DNA ligase [Ferroplasma sp.]
MQFSEVSKKFMEMETTTKRLELTSILGSLLSDAGEDLKELVYLIQGKLAPDYEGIEFGISGKLIVKSLATASGRSEEEVNKLFFKNGDLGTTAAELRENIRQAPLVSEELTLHYVYTKLLDLANSSGHGSVKGKIDIYSDLFMNSNPNDIKYITRIIMGKLRLGVADSTILDSLVSAFSEKKYADIIDTAYNFHPDIGLIATLLQKRDIKSIENIGPEPLVPFKVMLAERLKSIDDIREKMNHMAAYEYKYDGLRTELHKKGEKIKIFSRGLEETTDNFPDIVSNFKKNYNFDSIIIDGESVPYNPETGELFPFQMVSKRRGRKYELDEKSLEIPLVMFIFDILELNGKSLVNTPYQERRKILEENFKDNEYFRLATRLVSDDREEINKFFEKSIEDGCEGVVAKNTSSESVYRAGARGWLWIKFKRDYQKELADSMDLVVIGAFNGHGRRAGAYGALLMASYNEETQEYESFTKLGTGFSDEVLFSLPKMFSELKEDHKPAMVNSKMVPDVWFYPEIVMEIQGAEITVSPIHTCAYGKIEKDSGLALRFPRLVKIRDDKKADDATTTNEIIELYKMQKKTK